MHNQPGSPKKPCWAACGDPPGLHQWIWWGKREKKKKMCWICGARWPTDGKGKVFGE